MKTNKIQGDTYLVFTNGSMVKILTTSTKRIHVLSKDLFTESYWNPLKINHNLNWKDTWSKYNWTHVDSK